MAYDSYSLLSAKEFGDWLRTKRLEVGLTQNEVAKFLNYSSAQFISNWERGLASPPINVLPILAKKYSISDSEMIDKINSIFLLNLKSMYKRAKQL